MDDYWRLLVVWLLGLLAPSVIDEIRRRRSNTGAKAALMEELNDVAGTVALAAFTVRRELGTLDREFLQWLKQDCEHFGTTNEQRTFPEIARGLLSAGDEALAIANAKSVAAGTTGILQRYQAVLLDALSGGLWNHDRGFRQALLGVKHHLALLDDLVDRQRKFFDMTYAKLDTENHILVEQNLIACKSNYASRAQLVVTKIRELQRAHG